MKCNVLFNVVYNCSNGVSNKMAQVYELSHFDF